MNEQEKRQIDKLVRDLADLQGEVFKNNFTTRQDFNKASSFNSKLKIPHYASVPSVGEVGEIIEVNGVMYICETANTFVVVGTQV